MSSKKSKITGLLSKGFKSDKCKTSIRMAVARMKLMRNKRGVQVTHVRREVAQLLETKDESTARIRVDHVIRDEKTISAYELLEVYCELIIQRLHFIDSQKTCPIDLKEAIATVVFAAPRCADIPELLDVTKHFQAKYGKEFITSALELRPGSGVSQLVVEKLSANSANIETKVKVLKSIAEENNVKWDGKGFEEEVKAPQLGRLEGSSKFLSVSEAATVQQPVLFQTPPPPATNYQPHNYTPQPPPATNYQPQNYTPQPPPAPMNYQPQNYTPQYNAAHQPTIPNNSSSGISDPPLASPVQVVKSQSGSRRSESKYDSEEEAAAKKTPSHLPDHGTEYTTVEEAAEAAAKSAELASKAAKAAAAMARHGSLSREQSNVSSKSYNSQDSSRKLDTEEVSSMPETQHTNTPSMQTNIPRHAKGSQVGPSKPSPDRSPVAPASPSFSHSPTSSSSDGELTGYKQNKVVQKEEEHDYSSFKTGYNKSNSRRGSTTSQGVAVWDDNGDEGEPEVISSNIRFDSSEPAFDDSRHVYEEEPFSRFEREKSFGSKGAGTSWFSSDNFSSPKLPTNDSSSPLFTSNTSKWDPPRSPVDANSGFKFDKGHGSPNDGDSSLLSVLSGLGPPQSRADEDSGPKFDSGPTFDSEVFSDDENDKVNFEHVHVAEEKVEEEYFTGSSKEKKKDALVSSSDENNTKKLPQSMRNRRNPSEMVQPDITKEPRVKAEKAPLRYAPKENNNSDDDSENEQVLNYNTLMGGKRNRSGYKQSAYTVKPLAEESKKPMADFSVEEERLYAPNRLNNRESVKPTIYSSSTIERASVPRRYDKASEDLRSETPELDDSGESSYDLMNRKSKRELDNPKPLSQVSRRTKAAAEVRKNLPSRDNNTTSGDELSERKEPPRRTTLRYTPNRRNFDDEEEEEEAQEELAKPVRIKVKVSGSSRVSDYLDFDDKEEREEEAAKPAKIKLKEPSSSRVSKDYFGSGENELDYQEPGKANRREVGNGGRKEELEVRKERTKKEAPSKSSETRTPKGPLRYAPTREDSDEEEEQVRRSTVVKGSVERTKKEAAPSKSSETRTPKGPLRYAPTREEDSDEEEKVRRSTILKDSVERTKKEAAPSKSSESRTPKGPLRYAPTRDDSDEEEQVPNQRKERGSKEKVDMKEKKEEKASGSTESEKKEGGAPPTFPRTSFPLDMDALRARVQQIQATMNNG